MTTFYKRVVILFIFSVSCFSCEAPTREFPELGLPMLYEWENASCAELGLDSALIAEAVEMAGFRRYINSILIARNGKIAAEKYFNGFINYSEHNLVSISKSILSALIGIAIDQNLLSVDDKMMNFFPEYDQPTIDPVKFEITIEQLLTMQSGLQSEGQAENILSLYDDLMGGIVYIPLDTLPGTRFRYSSLGTHLLSGVLTKAASMSSIEFANYYLLEPMKISIEGWSQDSRGYYTGGSGMFFTTRNLAAFGQMYLNKGRLNDTQIISESWIDQSLQRHSYEFGSSWDDVQDIGYGYLWWLGSVNDHKVFFALGYGGQYLFCVPDYNLLVVITAIDVVNPNQSEKQETEGLQIITQYILPAVLN